MSVSVNVSKETGGKETNNLVHPLNPKTFVKMFTIRKCTFEEKLIQDILKCICALRNSGGGKLTIWFTETCSTSAEAEKCVEIIKNAVNEVLSDTGKADLLEWKISNRIMFLVQGSKEIVTMKYNMYVMTDGEAKLVPSTKSAAEVRSLLHGFHGGTPVHFKNYSAMKQASVSARLSPISNLVKGKKVKMPTKYDSEQMIRFELLSNIQDTSRSIESAILLDAHKRYLPMPNHYGGHVYYGISSDGTVCGEILNGSEQRKIRESLEHGIKWNANLDFKPVRNNDGENIPNLFVIDIYVPPFGRAARCDYERSYGFYPSLATPPFQLPSISFTCSREGKIEKRKLHQVELVKDQHVKVPTKEVLQETVEFRILEDDKLTRPQNSVAYRITLAKNKLLAYVSAFANHRGGELYYGISPDGTVCGETISEIEIDEVYKNVKEKLSTIVWPTDAGKIHKFWEITFLHVKDSADIKVKDQDALNPNLYVIKICVKLCQGGVFVRGPESYHVVENSVKNLPFHKWFARLQDSTTKVSDSSAFVEFKKDEKAFDRLFLPNDYQTCLKRLEWVESFKIVDANEECNVRHLEIVCKFGKVPCTPDIVNIFGEDILPLITYQECSKRDWFETTIFDENYAMKKEYKNELTSFSWVKDFYIGVANVPEKSWQIYITYARDNAPSMVDLKKLFGANIASFVDFIQDSKDDKKSLPPPRFLRGPRSGDKLCARPENETSGTIGILSADREHYATTCYHSCFNADVPESIRESIPEIHQLLKNDYENESLGCQGTVRVYTETPNDGQFRHGLYDDDHDIAIIELNWPGLNCTDAVNFLNDESVKPELANNKEVAHMFFTTGNLPVKKFGAITETTEGEFYAIDSAPLFGTTIEIPYRIKGIQGQTFAKEGDSGSLVYLEYDNERKPFGYLCSEIPESGNSAFYGCRNLNHSIKELIRRRNLSNIQPCFNNNH